MFPIIIGVLKTPLFKAISSSYYGTPYITRP
jgi:hypothetical protein